MSYFSSAVACAIRGDFEQARSDAEMAVRLCETHGVLTYLAASYSAWGWALSHVASPSEGLIHLERAASLYEAAGAKLLLSRMFWGWAQGLLLSRDYEVAREKALHGLKLARKFQERGVEAEISLLLAEIDIECGQTDAANTLYRQAASMAEELGMRPVIAHCHLGLGKLYRSTGKRDQALEHLSVATTMYREMDMRFWLEQANAELQEIS